MASSSSMSEVAGEQEPLTGEGPTAILQHRDSVYSFLLFLPPLTRRTHGHYCTLPVLLAILLLGVTITCQLSLTLIAGGYIRSQSANFKVSLIRHEEWQATALTPVDWVRERAAKLGENIGKGWATRPVDQCCDSAECISLFPCCAPGTKSPHREQAASSSGSFLHMPAKNSSAFKNLVDKYVLGSSGNVALCRKDKDGLVDCSPPSYSYLDAWHELDDNGDGLWSLEEAEADRKNLGCRLGLSPTDLFSAAVRGIIQDARDTADNSYAIPLVPQSIENRKSIPKEYFEHFQGLVVLCTAFDVGRCGQLISQGVFDGAIGLKSAASQGGIHDLDSALDFCQRMLRADGVCDRSLPHTYRLYRSRVAEKCGAAGYDVGAKYTNKNDPRDAMSVVHVSYDLLSQYEEAAGWQFQVFLSLILIIWYVTLVLELSRIIQLFDMLANLPHAHHASYSLFTTDAREGMRQMSRMSVLSSSTSLFSTPRLDTAGREDAKLPGIDAAEKSDSLIVSNLSRPHFYLCLIMAFVRFFLWFYMANVGTTFLLATFSYDDLLFNAVALAFIFELPEFLYSFLVQEEMRVQLENAETRPFPTSLPTQGWKLLLISRAFWGLVFIPLFVWGVMEYNMIHNVSSSLEALNCACFQRGPNCVAAQRFTSSWWNQYWINTAPLAKLRASYLG